MSETSFIKKCIREEMEAFEPFFKARLKTKIPLLDIITTYLLRRKGKQMRPMLVFLSAKLNGTVCESTYVAASLIEILHTATLIHDDVVDETYQRRGFFSINALWKSKIAVLVGDYFLSKGLLTALDANETGILKIVSEAVREMSEGELLQIEKSRKLNITEEIYFEVIGKKTASLLASCTAAGAHSVKADEETIAKMKEFGQNLGIAFQIRDDLFDFEQSGLIGKPTGNDIKEKKLTLPLIYVLNQSNPGEKRQLLSTIRKHHRNDKKVQEIIKTVIDKGGMEYAREKMNDYANRAKDILNQYPESDVRKAMEMLVDYTINRKK
ncbi:octaprenyl-diphosphate synthase [Breznakibacter xylanolyticus]|uniref:Octaprenyl-diphosphate synthase n=1 Tax=Breznakibacter xylanolyticus TaxID=990 RepID=A0A2W7NS40_9BACT|nr:polyprenyl synthetase family protein [Breznakibacter xylanolyticus]PZX19434.1 octaprenyl-diphosphate synthase [Breznakibacter xylanolyticus]